MIFNYNKIKPGHGLCKFNNYPISDENFTEKLRNFIENLKVDLDSVFQWQSEMGVYEVRDPKIHDIISQNMSKK